VGECTFVYPAREIPVVVQIETRQFWALRPLRLFFAILAVKGFELATNQAKPQTAKFAKKVAKFAKKPSAAN
jgi:hypothetical protein